METKTYAPTEMCSRCKGVCCNLMGCEYSPRDFSDLSFESLKGEIEKGRISIDWWENGDDKPDYYLRARHIYAPVVDPSWGGRCINLTATGCSLSWEERPLGGKALKPKESFYGSCVSSYGKEAAKDEWKAYSDVLKRLVDYFKEKEED